MLFWRSEARRRSYDMSTKTFDAVKFMRQMREKMNTDMRDMRFEEQREYIEQHASKVRVELEAGHGTARSRAEVAAQR
jgi:hypothetical protein